MSKQYRKEKKKKGERLWNYHTAKEQPSKWALSFLRHRSLQALTFIPVLQFETCLS